MEYVFAKPKMMNIVLICTYFDQIPCGVFIFRFPMGWAYFLDQLSCFSMLHTTRTQRDWWQKGKPDNSVWQRWFPTEMKPKRLAALIRTTGFPLRTTGHDQPHHRSLLFDKSNEQGSRQRSTSFSSSTLCYEISYKWLDFMMHPCKTKSLVRMSYYCMSELYTYAIWTSTFS